MLDNRHKRDFSALWFLLPALIIYLSVIIAPLFYSFYISLFKWNGIGKMTFVGLGNFQKLFSSDPVFHTAIKNNMIWIVLSTVLTMLVGLGLALLLNKHFKGRTVFRGIFYYPCILSAIAASLTWRWIYDANIGFINEVIRALGGSYSQHWVSNPSTALYATFVASLWNVVGKTMILFLAGLQTVPQDSLEAATIDGANSFQKFLAITIPSLRETFIIVFSTLIIDSMKVYDVIKGLTDGGPNHATEMLATYMYSQSFRYNNVGLGTAVACVMVLIMMIVIIPYISFTARER